jgi:hypothetical protein
MKPNQCRMKLRFQAIVRETQGMIDNKLDAIIFGAKGGAAKTARKRRASIANGKRGGRPQTKTLGAFLLRRQLSKQENATLLEAYQRIGTHRHREDFRRLFGLPENVDLNTTDFTRPQRVGKEMAHVLRSFRLIANHLLSRPPRKRKPKEYIVEYKQRETWEQDLWENKHPGIPCPPRPKRIHFKRLLVYSFFRNLRAANPEAAFPTIAAVKQLDSTISDKVAQAILDDLLA